MFSAIPGKANRTKRTWQTPCSLVTSCLAIPIRAPPRKGRRPSSVTSKTLEFGREDAPSIRRATWSGTLFWRTFRSAPATSCSASPSRHGGYIPSGRCPLTNRSWQREVWILAARLLDRAALQKDLRGSHTNRSWQMQMYLDTLFTTCARGNTALRIFCH
jgi:hypothetical protein